MVSPAHPFYTTKAHYGWWFKLMNAGSLVVAIGWPVHISVNTFESLVSRTVVILLLFGFLAVCGYHQLNYVSLRFEVWLDRMVIRHVGGRSKEISFDSIKSVKMGDKVPSPLNFIEAIRNFTHSATSIGPQVVVHYGSYQEIRLTPHDPKALLNELEVALSEYQEGRTIRA